MGSRTAFLRVGLGAALTGLVGLLVTTVPATAADSGGRSAQRAAVTVLESPANGVASVSVIGPDGTVRRLWRCPRNRFCGDLVSAAWAPDGRRLALSLTEFGGRSLYPGLHVIDTKSGHDVNLNGFDHDVSGRSVSVQQWMALYKKADPELLRFGCFTPSELAWSPDGSKIAYACAVDRNGGFGSELHVVNADGSHPRLLRTGTTDAAWPTWSPNGSRIAFSTGTELRGNVRRHATQPEPAHSDIYTIGLDGRGRRLIARQGVAPAWSPDGTTVAYRAACGRIRLVTPAGRDTTNAGGPAPCSGLASTGWPAWSADGSRLVIGSKYGVSLVDADGFHVAHIRASSNSGITSELRPVVRPAPAHALATAGLAAPVAATAEGVAVTLPLRAGDGVYSLSLIAPDGTRHEVWRCPRNEYCGELTSVSWAPGGTRVALSFDEFGGHSTYPGLHVVDTTTGSDQKLFGLSESAGSVAAARSVIGRFGCWNAVQLAWSPDGSKIAYACATVRNRYQSSEIHIIDADGGHPRLLRTGTVGAAWPSWSPTGTRIAFSTGNWPREGVRTNTGQPKRVLHSVIYSVDLGGAHRRRIATGAEPAWSPDGSAIAYRSDCRGRIRLVTPAGIDATPAGATARCAGIGPEGVPAWVPGGSRLAIGNENGVYLIDPDGTDLTLVRGSERAGLGREIRPSLLLA